MEPPSPPTPEGNFTARGLGTICPQPLNPCHPVNPGAAGAPGWVSRAGPSQGHPAAQELTTSPTHREIFKWCQVYCLCGRKKIKKIRPKCKENGADSCLTHPVGLSQRSRQASLASEQKLRNLQILWNFSPPAGRGGDGAVTSGETGSVSILCFSSLSLPTPTLLLARGCERPLVSDVHSTRQSRKPLERALRSPVSEVIYDFEVPFRL